MLWLGVAAQPCKKASYHTFLVHKKSFKVEIQFLLNSYHISIIVNLANGALVCWGLSIYFPETEDCEFETTVMHYIMML
jgi:hypothetical protein